MNNNGMAEEARLNSEKLKSLAKKDIKRLTKEEAMSLLESRFFSRSNGPIHFVVETARPYRKLLAEKTEAELKAILRRIKNWNWIEVHRQFLLAAINNKPFLPLENPTDK